MFLHATGSGAARRWDARVETKRKAIKIAAE